MASSRLTWPFRAWTPRSLEVNPTLVESIDHLHARQGMAHTLLTENLLPLITRDDLSVDGSTQGIAECFGHLQWRHTRSGLEFDDSLPGPVFPEEVCCGTADVCR